MPIQLFTKKWFQLLLFAKPSKRKDFLQFQLIRFVFVGGTSALFELGLLLFFTEVLSIHYLISNFIAFSITNVYNYYLSRVWVYGAGQKSVSKEATSFIIIILIALLINQGILFVLVDYGEMSLLPSKVIAIVMTIIWTFLSKRQIVFR